jgi:hypothetical protein
MKFKSLMSYSFLLVIGSLVYSCTSEKVVSDQLFQKRKYRSGFHLNLAKHKKADPAENYSKKERANDADRMAANSEAVKAEEKAAEAQTDLTAKNPTTVLLPKAVKKRIRKASKDLVAHPDILSEVIKNTSQTGMLESPNVSGEGNTLILPKPGKIMDGSDTFALLSFIFGICALVFLFIPYIGLLTFLLGPAAIVFGFMGLSASARWQAILGLILGFLWLLILLAIIALVGVLLASI